MSGDDVSKNNTSDSRGIREAAPSKGNAHSKTSADVVGQGHKKPTWGQGRLAAGGGG